MTWTKPATTTKAKITGSNNYFTYQFLNSGKQQITEGEKRSTEHCAETWIESGNQNLKVRRAQGQVKVLIKSFNDNQKNVIYNIEWCFPQFQEDCHSRETYREFLRRAAYVPGSKNNPSFTPIRSPLS